LSSARLSKDGISFQLNCFSPNNTVTVQQSFWRYDGNLSALVQTWIDNDTGTPTEVINDGNIAPGNLTSDTFPAGSTLSIALLFDQDNKVNGGVFDATVGEIKFKSTMLFDQLTTFSERQPDAPIVAFTFDIVASANFNTAHLKQGSGTVTYKSETNSFEPVNQFPCQLTLQGTGENGNTEYGEVDNAAARSITQSWGVKN
jgi:hypothetical protein